MKKSVRLFLTGNVQPVFFDRFVKENADQLNIRGFMRYLEDKRIEIFVEGNIDSVNKMVPLCKRGPRHSLIRKFEEKEEKFHGFKDFQVFRF